MKIAYVVEDYTNSGGMERVLFCKADYFINLGYEVFIISSKTSEKPFFSFNPKIKLVHLETSSQDKKYLKEYLKELTACLNEIKPDISISTGLGNGRYLYEIQDGSKKILEIHFSKYRRKYWLTKWDKNLVGRFLSDLYTAEKTRIARNYDKFIVLTKEDKESWRGFNNIGVISNPLFAIPTEFSDTISKKVIFVGRFTFPKGYPYMINVWEKVAKRHPDWKLVAYGNGRRRKQIEEMVAKKGLSNVVELNDSVQDMYKALREGSIYAMTSMFEGQGLSLIEGMACGLPAVSFATKCGPSEIISNGEDGFLVPFRDVDACAQKICELIEDPEMRKKMGKAASRNMLRYSLDKIMPQWISLFEELLEKK